MKQKLWSEFFGTFALVFFGTGAVVVNDITGVVTLPGVALTFAMVVTALIYTFGDISGAHFNPAVTLAFAVAKKFKWAAVVPYIAAQVIGGIVASALVRILFPAQTSWGVTTPRGTAMQSLLLEIMVAWLLMLVILNVSTGPKEKGITAGLVVGAVIGLEALFAGPISGASMNPARSIGPALISLQFGALWIYILGPIVGALLAVPTFHLVRSPDPQQEFST